MKIAAFETKEYLGGGMGRVYKALDTRDGRIVALKTVPNKATGEEGEVLEAAMLGARLLRLLSKESTRVPEVYEMETSDDDHVFYVSMEYLDGGTLADLIARAPLPADRACEIALELCAFLEEAHGFETMLDGKPCRTLMHGDLKPSNIHITRGGQVKIYDFGIAKVRTLLSGKVPRTDFGSLGYLPPERLEEPPAGLDEYTDLWALGIILYEMVAGRRPFRAPGTNALKQLILSRPAPPPPGPGCPPALSAVIGKLLAPTRDDRYATVDWIRRDLEAVRADTMTLAQAQGWPRHEADAADGGGGDTPPTVRTRSGGEPAPDVPTVRTSPPRKTLMRRALGARRRWKIAAGAALALLLMMLVSNEIVVAREAAAAAGLASRRTLAELAGSWDDYQHLTHRSTFGFGTGSLKTALTRRTRAAADAVIDEYRNGITVMSARWALTRDALTSAVDANRGDPRLLAALRYCSGHIHRIDGAARDAENRDAAAQQEYMAAITDFRAAAELRQGWPDPFLGLFRTFAVGLADIERAQDALARAEQLGYARVPRETALLAGAYDTRARSLEASARGVDPSVAIDALTRASQAYLEAAMLYDALGDYGSARREAFNSRRRQIRVDQRLRTLLPAAPLPDPVAAATVSPWL